MNKGRSVEQFSYTVQHSYHRFMGESLDISGIVMGTVGLRERLDNLVHAKQFPECVGCILWALVAVKQQALRLTAGYKYLFKGFHDQPGADVF